MRITIADDSGNVLDIIESEDNMEAVKRDAPRDTKAIWREIVAAEMLDGVKSAIGKNLRYL